MPLDLASAAHIREHDGQNLDIAQMRADYFSDGVLIVRNLIEPSLLAEMRARFCGLFRSIIAHEGAAFPAEDELDALHDAAAAAIGSERAKHFLTMGRDF